jgi:hypothetical protein
MRGYNLLTLYGNIKHEFVLGDVREIV